MENLQEQHNDLKGEVAQLAAKMDQVLEMLANRSRPPPLVNEETATTEPANVAWPTFGLPPGYTPPGYVPLADGVAFVPPLVNNTENQAGTTLVQPEPVPSQEVQEDPRNAYLGPEIQSGELKPDFAFPQLEEAKMKFKAIEDKLRMMESFLPNNVSPPYSHSRSTVSARTPCFNHQYPTVVQPQHQPPLKEQPQPLLKEQHQPLLIEQPQPFFIKQPQHQPLLIEQHQPFLIKQPQSQPLLIEQSQPFLIKQPQPQPLLIEQPQPLLIEQPQPFLIKQP
ncbi:hypothetical protein QL285_032921 [Trifolium repens]|nr:hypothetical protein QL285_032921 [Trifolium repens]